MKQDNEDRNIEDKDENAILNRKVKKEDLFTTVIFEKWQKEIREFCKYQGE